MKLWIAEVIEVACDLLCALLGHVHGCFLLNNKWSPLHRPHRWALNVRNPITMPGPKESA